MRTDAWEERDMASWNIIQPLEERQDFYLSDEDFDALAEWYLAFSEKRELLGSTNHLLYICRKRNDEQFH